MGCQKSNSPPEQVQEVDHIIVSSRGASTNVNTPRLPTPDGKINMLKIDNLNMSKRSSNYVKNAETPIFPKKSTISSGILTLTETPRPITKLKPTTDDIVNLDLDEEEAPTYIQRLQRPKHDDQHVDEQEEARKILLEQRKKQRQRANREQQIQSMTNEIIEIQEQIQRLTSELRQYKQDNEKIDKELAFQIEKREKMKEILRSQQMISNSISSNILVSNKNSTRISSLLEIQENEDEEPINSNYLKSHTKVKRVKRPGAASRLGRSDDDPMQESNFE